MHNVSIFTKCYNFHSFKKNFKEPPPKKQSQKATIIYSDKMKYIIELYKELFVNL